MPKKPEDMVTIVCTSRSYLAPLKTMGPILNPISVTKSQLSKLVLSGAVVSIMDPKTKRLTRITTDNLATYDKYKTTPVEIKSVPVVDKEVTGVKNVAAPVVEPTVIDPVVEEVVVLDTAATTVIEEVVTTQVVEEVSTIETQTVSTVETVIVEEAVATQFTLTTKGLVDETVIDWASMTKDERKALRLEINTFNATVTA